MADSLKDALKATYDAWRALAPVDADFARKVGKLLADVRERREEGDLGGRPSLRDYELRKKYDMRLADANPVKALRAAAFVHLGDVVQPGAALAVVPVPEVVGPSAPCPSASDAGLLLTMTKPLSGRK